jgi:hypothetical protein
VHSCHLVGSGEREQKSAAKLLLSTGGPEALTQAKQVCSMKAVRNTL